MTEEQQRSAVVAEALSWLGTGYHHHARIKGVGVDCAQIVCAVFEACGLVEPIDPGYYATDWHLHRSEEVYTGWCARYATPVECPQPGDVVLFRFGRCFSHAGIVVEADTVVHAYVNSGVILTRFSEAPLAGREMQAWSIWA
jgi:NlpC/P60 family putative phage cell wall peptidase